MAMQFRIYDAKAETYGQTVTSQNEKTILREVETLIASGTEPYASHPEDYSLFKVADILDDEPLPIPCKTAEHVVSFHHIARPAVADTLKSIQGGE
jgi:uncharacterized protein YegP (UPF0339 family)